MYLGKTKTIFFHLLKGQGFLGILVCFSWEIMKDFSLPFFRVICLESKDLCFNKIISCAYVVSFRPFITKENWVFSMFFLNLFIYLFIYFWLHWVFIAARRLSLVAASGGYSSLQCAGFSLQWLLLSRSTGSRCAGFSSCGSWALEHRLSSYGARA